MRSSIILFLTLFLITFHSYAQNSDTCPSMAQTALEMVQNACEVTGRNQACYGNNELKATAHTDDADFVFEQAGDMVDIITLKTLEASSLNVTDNIWGIALLRVQANLPDTSPGQNVTMIFVGDVYAENRGEALTSTILTTTIGANVRRQPDSTKSNIMKSVEAGQDVTATGKLADGSWIRITDELQSSGWIASELLTGDMTVLPVVERDAGVTYGAMQAFYFSSGIHDEPCESLPASGILVQTPKGAAKIDFLINQVHIQLGSTVYLQAQSGDYLYITVLEGSASVIANGVSQLIPAGAIGRVPLGADGFVSGTPEFPRGYTNRKQFDWLLKLLPESIMIAEPLQESEIQEAIDEASATPTEVPSSLSQQAQNDIDNGLPPSGRWRHNVTLIANTCDPSTGGPVGSVYRATSTMTFSPDRSSLTWDLGYSDSNGHLWVFTAGKVGEDTYAYTASWGSGVIGTITFTSSTTYFATNRGDFGAWEENPACIYYLDYDGRFMSG